MSKVADDEEDKYKAMIVTPEGSIIRVDGKFKDKVETDPDWEERKAALKAKRKRPYEASTSSADEDHPS